MLAGGLHAQSTTYPRIGYVYPAGGRQGTTVEITVGGQYLRAVKDVLVTGPGVHAEVVKWNEPMRPLNGDQARLLRQKVTDLRQKLLSEGQTPGPNAPFLGAGADPKAARFLKGTGKFAPQAQAKATATPAATAKPTPAATAPTSGTATAKATPEEPVTLPDYPMYRNLDQYTLPELDYMVKDFLKPMKRQQNSQIGETVTIRVTIDQTATAGDREIRLRSPIGLSNPLRFQVGQLPEVCEREPNDPDAPTDKALVTSVPVLLNGQITPGDVDNFRVQCKAGQKLVIQVQARALMPYLADAVPGWFQAVIALYGPNGKEVAYADDFRFDPDPVLYFEIPADGQYRVEIRDSIFRGREDFVYRIAISERPFVTGLYPLGTREGTSTTAWITGWNLAWDKVQLDAAPGRGLIRQASLQRNGWLSNPVTYAVDDLPESYEQEPNDSRDTAQKLRIPQTVNGYIGSSTDKDMFSFDGKAGQKICAEIFARRLRSPLNSLLRLTDAKGNVLAWNDDHEDIEFGMLTHHADSALSSTLPKDGTYFIEVSDTERHGGSVYGYRLRLTPPEPDFALRIAPSTVNVPCGRAATISVHAVRKDGFDGDIDVALRGEPNGFTLSGAKIPRGADQVRMTLTAPSDPTLEPEPLQLEGSARIDGKTVTHVAVPTEDMMQAFAYRHLVPVQELLAFVQGPRRVAAPVSISEDGPVRIPTGGIARVRVKTQKRPILSSVQLELRDPPKGISLQDVSVIPEGLSFYLKADGTAQAGLVDNAIVEAFAETSATQTKGKAAAQKSRYSLGILPAIPIEVVKH